MASQPNPDHPAFDLLARAHSSQVASELFVNKVFHKPLNLRPTSPDPNSKDARAARRRERLLKKKHAVKRSKPKRLSAKEKRALGIYDIPKSDRTYDLFVPLHNLWLGYMREILNLNAGQNFSVSAVTAGPTLASADYHGAKLEVVRSRCVGRVGIEGIVMKDNKFSFELITKENMLKVVPKEHTIFRFEIPHVGSVDQPESSQKIHTKQDNPRLPLSFELHGTQFTNRAPDRAKKQIKQKRMDDL